MAMSLGRNRSNGVISNGRAAIVLRGGHYHLFGAGGGFRNWFHVVDGRARPFIVTFPRAGADPNPDGCARDNRAPVVLPRAWASRVNMLQALADNGGNLVRVFLSNGVDLSGSEIIDLHPFARAGGRWRVAAAIRDGRADAWSAEYFKRLHDFVAEADARGVAVQLCIFSHHDMRADLETPGHSYWPRTFWNPANIDDPAWGAANLVSVDTGYLGSLEGKKALLRNQDFMNTARAGLMRVQRLMVEKVLEAVSGFGNVILELINEPQVLDDERNPARPSPGVYQATWLNAATGWILAWLQRQGTGWRPLIAANATRPRPGTPWDVDAWATTPALANYEELDVIAFHGLTGYPASDVGEAHCGISRLPAVDRESIRRRVAEHRSKHGKKSLVLSTDAVRHFPQEYPGASNTRVSMLRREGQVRTSLGYDQAVSVGTERVRADLDNWAYHTLRHGFDRDGNGSLTGSVHFQNHSSGLFAFQMIGAAAAAAQGVQAVPAPERDAVPDEMIAPAEELLFIEVPEIPSPAGTEA